MTGDSSNQNNHRNRGCTPYVKSNIDHLQNQGPATMKIHMLIAILALLAVGCQTTDATVTISPTIHPPAPAVAISPTIRPAAAAELPPKPTEDAASAAENAESAAAMSPEGTLDGSPQYDTSPSPLAASAPPCIIIVNISTDKEIPVTTTAAGGIGDEASKGFWATARDYLASPFASFLP
jgi:hypothetical protein